MSCKAIDEQRILTVPSHFSPPMSATHGGGIVQTFRTWDVFLTVVEYLDVKDVVRLSMERHPPIVHLIGCSLKEKFIYRCPNYSIPIYQTCDPPGFGSFEKSWTKSVSRRTSSRYPPRLQICLSNTLRVLFECDMLSSPTLSLGYLRRLLNASMALLGPVAAA